METSDALTRSTRPLSGRVALVTGATSGIGLETAIGLAALGAEVIMAGRDPTRGQAALDLARERSGSQALSLELADLSLQAEVRALAERVAARHSALHVLVNNAGLITPRRSETSKGIEYQFAVNVLAPFSLTERLLPLMRRSAPARVVNVASEAHRLGKLDLDDPQLVRGWSRWRMYGTTKQALIMLTSELARRLAGSGVTANALHPGVVYTRFGSGAVPRLLWALARPFMIDAAAGARTSIYLASDPAVAEVSGGYFARCRQTSARVNTQDQASQARLWELCAALTAAPG